MKRIVIVGAGAAGLAAAETFRKEGYEGQLTLLGDEHAAPYDRPPLSKQVLAGTWNVDRIALRPNEHYAKLNIDLRTDHAVTGLDLANRAVLLGQDTRVDFDGLIIATGVTPRRLFAEERLAGVHTLRDMRDVESLRSALRGQPRLVIIGAGFLGAEVAGTARELGATVTMIDPLEAPMSRQVGGWMGAHIEQLHRSHGVRFRMGMSVQALVGRKGRVSAVVLSDGSEEPADCVLIAIGSKPAVEWLNESGLTLGNGIECDAYCCAAPGVYAAGDVASWPHPRYGRRIRLEHRINATEQGTAAARNLLTNSAEPFAPIPYFWSDQYNVKIQAHGLISASSVPELIEGSLADDRFVVRYVEEGTTRAILAWNSPKSALRNRQQWLVDSSN